MQRVMKNMLVLSLLSKIRSNQLFAFSFLFLLDGQVMLVESALQIKATEGHQQ